MLSIGAHKSPQEGMCVMEALAFAVGEPHTDAPKCVDSVLIKAAQKLNDTLSDTERQRLIAYIPRLIDTATDGKHRRRMGLLKETLRGRRLSCGCLECRIAMAISVSKDRLGFFDHLIEAPNRLQLNPITPVFATALATHR